jgi:hypothetical protein
MQFLPVTGRKNEELSMTVTLRTALVISASATALTVAMALPPVVAASNTHATTASVENLKSPRGENILALILSYYPAVKPPRVGDKAPGRVAVSGTVRTQLRVGAALGGNMWRIDLPTAVPLATAQRIAQQMMKSPKVIFAEPDRAVSISLS